MKKPERLIGFVNYNGIEFAFEFDDEIYLLKLYPPNRDVWKEYSGFKTFIEKINKSKDEDKWIESLEVEGVTSESNIIIFNVKDSSSNYQGFLSLEVNWYILSTNSLFPKNIQGFVVMGDDINRYYTPLVALENKIEIENNRAKKVMVSSVETLSETCGEYNIRENISVHTEVYAFASYKANTWISPIYARSELVTSFSKPVGIEILLESYQNLRRTFKLIKYQKKINFEKIELFNLKSDGEKEYSGLLGFKELSNQQSYCKVGEKIITHDLLGKNFSKFLEDSKTTTLGLVHLINSTEKTNTYTSSRIIMILIAFEQIYTAIYGKDSGRSDLYIEVKSDIIKIIDSYQSDQTGKRKGYAKDIKEYVLKRDSSFEAALNKSFIKYEKVIKQFVTHKYEGDFFEIIEGISKRMGELRNMIAHGRLNIDFLPIHINDFLIIEILIYVMLLEENDISDKCMMLAINQLFDLNIAFTK